MRALITGCAGFIGSQLSESLLADWFAKRRGERLSRFELGGLLAAATEAPGPVGVMFHHAVMDANERAVAGELLDLLASHRNAVVRPMRELLRSFASGSERRPALGV